MDYETIMNLKEQARLTAIQPVVIDGVEHYDIQVPLEVIDDIADDQPGLVADWVKQAWLSVRRKGV